MSRNGSPEFYKLLEKAAEVHDKKSHDYASNEDPFKNYHFAGEMSKLFLNPHDAGFIGRIGEKLYRLANLDNNRKIALNEKIEDTEEDLVVIMTLWMASRRTRRAAVQADSISEEIKEYVKGTCFFCGKPVFDHDVQITFRDKKSHSSCYVTNLGNNSLEFQYFIK